MRPSASRTVHFVRRLCVMEVGMESMRVMPCYSPFTYAEGAATKSWLRIATFPLLRDSCGALGKRYPERTGARSGRWQRFETLVY